MRLTTELLLVPRLRMNGAISPPPPPHPPPICLHDLHRVNFCWDISIHLCLLPHMFLRSLVILFFHILILSQMFVFRRVSHQNSVSVSYLLILSTFSVYHSLLDVVVVAVFNDLYKVRSCSICNVLNRSLRSSQIQIQPNS